MERLSIIDSHTGGEPTRVVIAGLPDLGASTMKGAVARLEQDFDAYRRAVVGEPRAPDFAVGAYLLPSHVGDCGVVFFNNRGYLGMCGHGTIGLVATLAHLGRIGPGSITLETPAGIVRAELHSDGGTSFENVPSYRREMGLTVEYEGGSITGDVAYGGNWFFIAPSPIAISREAIPALGDLTSRIQRALTGGVVDHVELTSMSPTAYARNFVRCPGGEYDRSPCGTGTSAKLACLFEDGKIAEGQEIRIESVIGSMFRGSIRREKDKLIPTIRGQAFVNGETTLLIDPADEFAWGIP